MQKVLLDAATLEIEEPRNSLDKYHQGHWKIEPLKEALRLN